MGNFQGGGKRSGGFRGGKSEGKPFFKKKSWGDDRGGARGDDRNFTMHKAVCSTCGESCQVPFRPVGDKPVYCSNCFALSKRENAGRETSGHEFTPRSAKRDFARPGARPEFAMPQGNDELKKQVEEVNRKLDRLIDTVEKLVASQKVTTVAKAESLPEPDAPLKEKIKKTTAKVTVKKKK